MGVFLEHVDEQPPDGLALDLRVAHPFERAKKQRALVGVDQRDVVGVAEHGQNLLCLAQPQQPVVHENAGQLVTDRLVDQHGGNGTVDPARQPADHLGIPHLRADLGDGLFAEGTHRPVAMKPRQPDKVFIQPRALGGVVHFGVELHGIEMPRRIGGNRERRVGRDAVNGETRGNFRHMVAVAHPDLFAGVMICSVEPAGQHRVGHVGRRHIGAAEFGGAMAAFHLAAKTVHHHLLAIADAKDRHTTGKGRRRRHRRAVCKDRRRATGKDDGFRCKIGQKRVIYAVVGVNFAIHIQFPQPARNQLRHLRAEVDDQKAVMLGHGLA